MALKIYVASSWRNAYYDDVLEALHGSGHSVWNWRKPLSGGNRFKWQDTGKSDYQHGDKIPIVEWRSMLRHQIAQAGFAADLTGMNWCDVGVLLHPCGKSAYLEAGWLAGRGKKVHVIAPEPVEPDLMVLALNGDIFDSINTLVSRLERDE